MTTFEDFQFEQECKELLKVYNLKGYRRNGNFFRAKYPTGWKTECSLVEFVWNYLKTPRFAKRLIDYVNSEVMDETQMKSWLSKGNDAIDAEVTFCDEDEAWDYLENNPSSTNVHCAFEGVRSTSETEFEIDPTYGDLFNGLVVDENDIPLINHVSVDFDTPKGIYTYIIHKAEFQNRILYSEPESDSEDSTVVHFLPLFKHPIPLVHFSKHDTTLRIKVVFETKEETAVDVHPLYTLVNEKVYDWLAVKTFNIILVSKEDVLKIGPKRLTLVPYWLSQIKYYKNPIKLEPSDYTIV